MKDIKETFRELDRRGEGALIAYVTGGDPAPKYTPKIIETLGNSGADIIEIGVPFSDPIADGPTIQAADMRALNAGTTPRKIFKIVKEAKRKIEKPVVLLTYYNPVFKMGVKNFVENARRYQVDGLIIPDLPMEEASEYKKLAESQGVDTVFLATPSTSTGRLKEIIAFTSGFLYLVSIFGVTGTRDRINELTLQTITRLHPHTAGDIPMAVGFGISKPEHVKAVLRGGAEGAIVGSSFVDLIGRNLGDMNRALKELGMMARKLKMATAEYLECERIEGQATIFKPR